MAYLTEEPRCPFIAVERESDEPLVYLKLIAHKEILSANPISILLGHSLVDRI
jgi:hypothetical protein